MDISMMKLTKSVGLLMEAVDVVRHIFDLREQGESMNEIAKILKKEKVYIPSFYAMKKVLKSH